MAQGFVHLRLHTEYSLIDSVVRVPELVGRGGRGRHAGGGGHRPEQSVRDGEVLSRGAAAAASSPSSASTCWSARRASAQPPSRLTLLCQSQAGYRNLTRLVTPRLPRGPAARHRRASSAPGSRARPLDGLIALSGAAEGDVGRALAQRPRARRGARAGALAGAVRRSLLPRAAAPRPAGRGELHRRRGRAGGAPRRAGGRHQRRALPDAGRFRVARGARLHSRRRAARRLRARRAATRAQQYLRTPQEMAALFADMPEALANTVEIARRCSLVLKLGEARLPQYPVPGGLTTEDFLRAESARGLAARGWRRCADSRTRPAYRARLRVELDVICQMGFAGYFLIVADFIRWARENGVPVGPGRGSGAGSLVAYSLGITDLDPLASRPAVRALPESRARVDAGLRRRLLHGRARPRHRLRGRASTAASASRRSSPTAPWPPRPWCATSAACSA